MIFSQAIATCMSKYAIFDGRASRSEFWWFYLFTVLLSWGASLVGLTVDIDWGPDLLSGLVSLAFLIPVIAAGTRRLHDTGKSGWWQLLFITLIGVVVLIVWMAQESSKAENKYGLPLIWNSDN